MSERIHVSNTAINTASDSFRGISDSIVKLRDLQVRTLAEFEPNNPELLFRLAKSDHVIWVDKVIRFALYGERSLTEAELKDHTQCRLGKFLDSTEGKKYSNHQLYSELHNSVHPEVHRLGITIFRAAKGNSSPAEIQGYVDLLVESSERVLAILDNLARIPQT